MTKQVFKCSSWILVQWDLKERHVIGFARRLFQPFPGLIRASDPALPLLLPHHHQAGFRHLPHNSLHGLAVALPCAWYLQGGVQAGDHLISTHGSSQQGLWELHSVPIDQGLQAGSIKVYTRSDKLAREWITKYAPFLIFSLITCDMFIKN